MCPLLCCRVALQGSAAYVGSDNAVFDVPIIGPLYGWYAGLLWKSFETYSQISFRNRCLVFTDWCVGAWREKEAEASLLEL